MKYFITVTGTFDLELRAVARWSIVIVYLQSNFQLLTLLQAELCKQYIIISDLV